MSSFANDLFDPLKKADLIIAIGTRLDEFTSQDYTLPSSEQKLIHIDQYLHESGINWSGCDLILLTDIGDGLKKLLDTMKKEKWTKPSEVRQNQVAQWREHYLVRTTPRRKKDGLKGKKIDLEEIFYDIHKIISDDTSITCDAGDFGGWLIRFYKWNKPHTFFGPKSGAMGYALPAAIAAKLERPKQPALAFARDGGFAMTMSEIETAVRLKLTWLVVIIFNNKNFGTIRRHQESQFTGRLVGTELGKIDFSLISKAMGADGFTVTKNEDFSKILKEA